MTTIAITIRDEHQKFIEDTVKSGRHVSENEVIAELKAREALRHAGIAELRNEVQIGLKQLDRGEGVKWDMEAVKAMGREILTGCA